MVNYSGGGDPYTAALGLVAQPYPMQAANNNNLGATSGVVIASLVRPTKALLTNLGLWLSTAGGTSTGVSEMGVYTEAGALLANTADMTAALTNAANNATYVEAALTAAQTLSTSANSYFALLCQLTSAPTIVGTDVGAGFITPTVKGHKPSWTLTGQTALPATVNIAATTTPVADFWFGGS